MTTSSPEKSIAFEGKVTGAGIINCPLAKLTVSANLLTISCAFFNYELKPQQVISIEKTPYGFIRMRN